MKGAVWGGGGEHERSRKEYYIIYSFLYLSGRAEIGVSMSRM